VPANHTLFEAKSGLGFTVTDSTDSVVLNDEFYIGIVGAPPRHLPFEMPLTSPRLGSFYHYNFPVFANITLPTSVKLALDLTIQAENDASHRQSVRFVFDIGIDETPK
jgi:hypothetical protein